MTTTLEEFTTALDRAFASVSEEHLNELLESWRELNVASKDSLKWFLELQFPIWRGVLKDKVKIDLQIEPDYWGPHRFLSFQNADLRDANLKGEDLTRVSMKGANLKGADLEGAYLKGAHLGGANLKGANLKGATLEGASLFDVNLKGANLKFAHMERAYLRDADLEDAELEGARLEGADLEGAKGLVDRYQNRHITFGARTKSVTINSETILPDELLCCYFNSALYPKNKGFIENPTTFAEWAKNFVDLYQDSSCRIVTPPQSRFNLEVSGDINAWVLAMLPRLEKAWEAREQDSTRLGIQQFLNGVQAGA